MNNPYEPPKSEVSDLTKQELPDALRTVLRLFWLSIGFWCAQIVGGFILDPPSSIEFSVGFFSIYFLLTIGVAFLMYFLVYYLCLYVPLSKRKRNAARWWFGTALVLSVLFGLGVFADYMDGSYLDKDFVLVNVLLTCEMATLFYGAYLLSRPACRVHLVN